MTFVCQRFVLVSAKGAAQSFESRACANASVSPRAGVSQEDAGAILTELAQKMASSPGVRNPSAYATRAVANIDKGILPGQVPGVVDPSYWYVLEMHGYTCM